MTSVTQIPRPSVEQVWRWLEEVPDPEIPVISVVDLGIVREVRWRTDAEAAEPAELVVAITPTYSGCPATQVIAADIERALRARGIERLRLEQRLAPPWSSDWISPAGREKLRAYGIAPPAERAADLTAPPGLKRRRVAIECPRCGSAATRKISEFGSTPCKAHYRCDDCLEPFDYFKCL